MKIVRFLLVLLFPISSFADGISVDSTTLQTAQFAFLVKLIALDSARHLAKVKILKKFAKPESVKNYQLDSVAWSELEKQPEVELQIVRSAEPRAGKWVIERRYWDSTRAVKAGSLYFALNTPSGFEWVEYSKEREEKFALFYDEERRNSELKKRDVSSLVTQMMDQDFRLLAGAELAARNELKLSHFLKPELRGHIFEILHGVLGRQEAVNRKTFLREGVEYSIKELRSGTTDSNLVIEFTQLFANYPEDRTEFSRESELMASLQVPPGDGKLRREIDRYHYEIKSRLDSNQPVELEKALDQVLQIYELMGADSTSSPHLTLDRFYKNLKGAQRSVMFQKIARSLARVGHEHKSSGELQSMLFELKKTPDIEAAKILIKMDHQKAMTNIKVAVLEAVFVSFEQSEEWKSPATQKSVLAFLDQYINQQIPNFLSDEVMQKYRTLKAK